MEHGEVRRWIDVHEGLYQYRGPDSGTRGLAYINEHQQYNRRWADVRAGGGMRSGISRGRWRQRGHERGIDEGHSGTLTISALSLALVLSSHAVTVRRGEGMVSHARARSTQARSLAHAMGSISYGKTARARPRRNGSRIRFFQTFVLSLLDHG
ncbi:hypothetical protein B0H13DRAFT_2029072 [Mycena leptocephala]|nr:hypothetical protein B0H13DRAFT_2029072 [Mycena leptocephala]